jgi:hypothetical protein
LRVALDEGVPEDVIGYLLGHDVKSVRMLGLKGVKNAKLLAAVTAGGFEAFISNDKRMEAEGQLSRRPFAILILSATNWNVIKPHVGNIAAALEAAKPGEVARVDVGRFVPKRLRRPQTPLP